MQPVLILQHVSTDGPAYLATWLHARGWPFEVRNSAAGQGFPPDLGGYGGLAVLGGEMSANDELPSLRQAERLIRQALRDGVPTLGHCLGGQLMARALGARVVPAPAPEVGWLPIDVADTPMARAWFGGPGPHVVFQWHYEAFELAPGAELLATSPACAHQAFAIGPHLAIQFHVELDAAKLERWSREEGERHLQALAAHRSTVQDGATMRAWARDRLASQQRLARRIYARWWAAAQAA